VRTAREALLYLSGIMQVAAERGLIPANPVPGVRKPEGVKEEVRPLSPMQLEALISALESRDRILVVLAGHLGLRPLEARTVPRRCLNERSCWSAKLRRKGPQGAPCISRPTRT
jgi:integrase